MEKLKNLEGEGHVQIDKKIEQQIEKKVEPEVELKVEKKVAHKEPDTVVEKAPVSTIFQIKVKTVKIPKKTILGKRSRKQTLEITDEIQNKKGEI